MATINCDMGERFGRYRMVDDAGPMPPISVADVACGAHAADVDPPCNTAHLGRQHSIEVGAHPFLPELQDYGRCQMKTGGEATHAACDAADVFRVPIMARAGALHETTCPGPSHVFRRGLFADLDDGDDGRPIISRGHEAEHPATCAERALRAVAACRLRKVGATALPVRGKTGCVHPGTPDAVAIAEAVRDAPKARLDA